MLTSWPAGRRLADSAAFSIEYLARIEDRQRDMIANEE
jgi:hypothetical protein